MLRVAATYSASVLAGLGGPGATNITTEERRSFGTTIRQTGGSVRLMSVSLCQSQWPWKRLEQASRRRRRPSITRALLTASVGVFCDSAQFAPKH